MRGLLLGSLLVMAAFPALAASSILKLHQDIGSEDSLLKISCADCPPAPEAKKTGYQPPVLASGVERHEIRDTDGAAAVYRVDKFMGGSPVLTVSRTQPPLMEQMQAVETKIRNEQQAAERAVLDKIDAKVAARQPPDMRISTSVAGIDTAAKTAAVDGDMQAAKPFDPASLKLRVD